MVISSAPAAAKFGELFADSLAGGDATGHRYLRGGIGTVYPLAD